MENKNSFTFKMTKSIKIDILKNFEIDSQKLITITQIVFQKRKYRTEHNNNNIHFNYTPRYTTHTGKNGIEGMKILRHGFIEFKKTPEEKIELTSHINLMPLIYFASIAFLFICLIGFISANNNGKVVFILSGLALFWLVIIIGRKILKQKVSSIMMDIKKNVA